MLNRLPSSRLYGRFGGLTARIDGFPTVPYEQLFVDPALSVRRWMQIPQGVAGLLGTGAERQSVLACRVGDQCVDQASDLLRETLGAPSIDVLI